MTRRTKSNSRTLHIRDTESDQMPVASSRTGKSRAKSGTRKKANRRRLLMEGLESRRLLAAVPSVGSTNATIDTDLFAPVDPRNIGTVQAFQVNDVEVGNQIGLNDSRFSAQFIPLGTGPGEEDTIDIQGTMAITASPQGNLRTDVDVYSFNLRAGDILDIAIQGAGANLTVLYGPPAPGAVTNPRANTGGIWFGTDTNQGLFHPDSSPLQTAGNAVAHSVVPHDGTYYLVIAPSTTSQNYTAGLRVYRPVAESLPIGAQQTVYVDFEGGTYPTSLFPGSVNPLGIIRFTDMRQNLGFLGLQDADYDELVDKIMLQMEQDFLSVINEGQNGNYNTSGNPGEFGIRLLNSRDAARGLYPEPSLDDPLVTRIFVGGTVLDAGIDGILGIAQSLDIGNFDMSENSIMPIDFFLPAATIFPIANGASVLDAVARRIGTTASHEAGHTFGLRHQNGNNAVGAIMDDPGIRRDEFRLGVGPDLIFGTEDDTTSEFAYDQYSLNEGLFGFQDSPNTLAFSLATGTVGSQITGRVFNDASRDGSSQGDLGIGNVYVFADVDLDGIPDPNEPGTHSANDGSYALNVPSGVTFNIIALTPDQFVPTIPTTRFAAGGTSGADFGFAKVVPDVTGTKFADVNGNGIFDATESGIEGVYIYLDLDGDDRPDLGEPSALTDANGNYTIDFPGPGTYTIREVVDPGFVQTFPANGEHLVNFNGIALADNYNFGNLPSRDYGDAPDSYQTSVATGGPSHGLATGVGLGAQVDREVNGFPSVDALGDDTNNIDDEDGIRLLSPLGPGGVASISVTARNNSTADSFLQGWIDFNANGVFDTFEQVFSNVVVAEGTTVLPVNVPADAVVGTTYARFRYSPTAGLGVGGDADVGEVEDYRFDILQQAAVANDDEFTVSRNSLSNRLDVLANDFTTEVTQLRITNIDVNGTSGRVQIIDGESAISYTPQNGFTGRDVFRYEVTDQLGNPFWADVVVNVQFQSNVPIAVDDIFEVPQGSSNRALNVLDNDIPSTAGGIFVTSVSSGDQGGTVVLEGGGQTIRYSPLPGTRTEQFTYSIEDANGTISTATVTVNSIPAAQDDDQAAFSIGFFDVVNNLPITNVQVGQEFFARVFVEDLDNLNPQGLASAFLDLLYTDELVATQDTQNSPFGFDISFGDLFQNTGGGSSNVFQLGDATTPGLINEVGSTQPISSNLTTHADPVELFTVRMNAVSPGVAVFAADPSDTPPAETIIVGEDVALTPAQIRYGRQELTIFPSSDNFASAIDDAFVNGVDSNGVTISADFGPNRLDVLANDIFGPTGTITEFGIDRAAGLGTATVNNNGTPNDLSDDFISYTARPDANGFDSFTYVIVSGDGVRSVAEVTLALGQADADDIVEIDFGLVDQNGNPITSVNPGQTFGVQVFVEDIRTTGNTAVFAAYLDILYNSDLINPVPVTTGRYDFSVAFGPDFDATAGVGTAIRDGIIDEFGTLSNETNPNIDPNTINEPNLMATLFFTAGSVTSSTTTQVIGSPADSSPFQDTLLFDRDLEVPVSQITYNVLNIQINPGSPLQNFALPEDVNNDGFVTPSDALSVINTLAAEASGEGESVRSHFYTDVNGDYETTARDALKVINYLSAVQASQLANGEGEGLAGTSDGGSHSAAFAGIGSSIDDDDDDDVLSLLADDQSEIG